MNLDWRVSVMVVSSKYGLFFYFKEPYQKNDLFLHLLILIFKSNSWYNFPQKISLVAPFNITSVAMYWTNSVLCQMLYVSSMYSLMHETFGNNRQGQDEVLWTIYRWLLMVHCKISLFTKKNNATSFLVDFVVYMIAGW